MRKGFRGAVAVTLALLTVGLALLQPVSGQPGQWRAINPVFGNLNDVWMVSATQGWAVGDGGTAIYWDGTQWRQILTPTLASLESVACLAANNCIAVGAGPKLLQWDGTSWVDRSGLIPLGVTKLWAVHIRSDGLGFAVGEGTPNILRLNVAVSPPAVAAEPGPGAPNILRSVWILPPATPGSIQGFAVGDNGGGVGAAWRWDGTPGGWLSSSPGAVGVLHGVHVLTPNDAIAVGDSDTRTRWNGANWTPEGGVVIATANWFAVYATASNDEWMVGTAVSSVASIAHWTGAAWSAFAPPNVPVAVNLHSVYMLSSSDGWAVGYGGAIIRWNGSSWNSVASPVASPNNLLGVWLASSADGWAVGDASAPTLGQIFRWNGANWNLYQTSPVAARLNEIHGSTSTNVFAVGDCPGGAPLCGAGVPPVIVRWTGGPGWVNISPAGIASNVNLHGVFAVSPSLAFAVGDAPGVGAPATMLRWDGVLWASISSGTDNGVALRSVWMVSGNEGWAVGTVGTAGTGTIVRWNGAAWSAETSPATTLRLNAVQALTSTNVWAVGDSGKIIHRDGIGWSVVPSGVTDNLYSLYMLSAAEGWAVGAVSGGSPVILYWDGSTWSRVYPTPAVAYALEDVWMVTSQDGWAVGDNGLILRFTGGPVTTASTATVTATSTTTQYVTSTSTVATSTVSTAVTSTQTASATTTTYVSTASETTTGTITLPPGPGPIPGFPLESILAGLVAGAAALFLLRRRRRT